MNLPLAPVVAGGLGGAVALCALLVPMPVIEGLVMASGLPAVLSAAEPPLGFTARAALALGSGGMTALAGWFGLATLLGERTLSLNGRAPFAPDSVAAPVIRRADAHPDAPPRPPLLATRDLGSPFFDSRPVAAPAPEPVEPTPPVAAPEPITDLPAPIVVRVEQPLPKDLDQPLSAFDPSAVPDVPMPAPEPVAPLARAPRPPVFDEGERFEVFELTPPARPLPSLVVEAPEPVSREEAITRPETEATVHALLERLERGVVRKASAPAPLPISTPGPAPFVERRARPRGLEDTLVTLRNLAQRA